MMRVFYLQLIVLITLSSLVIAQQNDKDFGDKDPIQKYYE